MRSNTDLAATDGTSKNHDTDLFKMLAPRPAQSRTARSDAETSRKPTEMEDAYQLLDSSYHAVLAAPTFGLSPFSLVEAWGDWASHLAVSPGRQQQLATKAMEKVSRLQSYLGQYLLHGDLTLPCISPLPQDYRFRHPGWRSFPFNLLQQSFLLTQQWWHNATQPMAGVTRQHQRLVEFYARQILDMISPSNSVFTNPEVIEKTFKESGLNLCRGAEHFADDAARLLADEMPAGTESFKAGVNLATTPGEVVFRNELVELIQYRPAGGSVQAEPILIVPAWIMKYYILDLSPENSLIRYLVQNGFTVFCISWRNPGREDRDMAFDDYRRLGVMAALDAVVSITECQRIHAVGYCLGGSLLAIAASAMARDGDQRFSTVTLFAAQVDFEEPGELGLFTDESQIALIEDLMRQEGFLDQRRMAGAFQMLRSQDLVWSRMVRDYLMGERRPISDLMAWNADATRMPARMHSEYLRSLFLNNDLAEGRFKVGGHPVYMEDIEAPVFAVATATDHVAPWRSVFKLTHLLDTEITFVLASGGHNAGIVSEPGHPGRWFQRLVHQLGMPRPDPDEWERRSEKTPGSWWPSWVEWLNARSTGTVAPPPMGNGGKGYPVLCPAPGTYVLQK